MVGRDIGTVVLPEAGLKVFLTASVEERAKRRYQELMNSGRTVSYSQVLEDLQGRDKLDTERHASPAKPAEDAQVINTDDLSVGAVVDRILETFKQRHEAIIPTASNLIMTGRASGFRQVGGRRQGKHASWGPCDRRGQSSKQRRPTPLGGQLAQEAPFSGQGQHLHEPVGWMDATQLRRIPTQARRSGRRRNTLGPRGPIEGQGVGSLPGGHQEPREHEKGIAWSGAYGRKVAGSHTPVGISGTEKIGAHLEGGFPNGPYTR